MPAMCVFGHKALDEVFAQLSGPGHAWSLKCCVGRADVRVKTAARSSDGIHRHRGIRGEPVAGAIIPGQFPHAGE